MLMLFFVAVSFLEPGAQPRFQSRGVQFLGYGYYCPSPEKKFRNVRVYPVWRSLLAPPDPTKKLCKKLEGVRPNFFWGVRTP